MLWYYNILDNIIFNNENSDPFTKNNYGKIHIRVFQRTNRKNITIVQSLDTVVIKYDEKKLLKKMKHQLCCNGHINEHKEFGKVFQFQGDKRDEIKKILLTYYKEIEQDQIEIHGSS